VWRSRMAAVVPYLRQLKNAGIPVLWRPFHEMNETWNWWGGRPGANGGAKIYQQMRDYFDSQGLDNLIWVWNVQDNPAGGWASYYPGSNYADVVSLDAWYKSYPSTADYQQIQSIAGSKPIAIAEMGKVPTAALFSSQPKWTYFMIWSEQLTGSNTNAEIQTAYFLPRVLNQGEITFGSTSTSPPPTSPPASGGGKIRGVASGKCADVAAASSANGTAVQLYTCDTNGTAQAWTMAGDGTVRALGKCLDVTGGVAADGTKVQIWDCTAGNLNQQWRYNATAQTLTNPATGRCLDATGQATANGTRLQVWTCNGLSNQRWTVPA
jgi:mannan endo-1,4-beta-mannosidase